MNVRNLYKRLINLREKIYLVDTAMTSCEEREAQRARTIKKIKDGVLMMIKPGWGRSFYDWSFAKCVILIVLGDKFSAGGIRLSHCLIEHFIYEHLGLS